MRFHLKSDNLDPVLLSLTEKDQWVFDAARTALQYQAIEPSGLTLRANLDIRPSSEGALSVLAHLNLSFDVQCGSCEHPFRLNLDFDIAELFCLDSKCGASLVEHPYGIDITYVTSPEIDFSELISERIRTELPYYMYCSSKCMPLALGSASGTAMSRPGTRKQANEGSRSIA